MVLQKSFTFCCKYNLAGLLSLNSVALFSTLNHFGIKDVPLSLDSKALKKGRSV